MSFPHSAQQAAQQNSTQNFDLSLTYQPKQTIAGVNGHGSPSSPVGPGSPVGSQGSPNSQNLDQTPPIQPASPQLGRRGGLPNGPGPRGGSPPPNMNPNPNAQRGGQFQGQGQGQGQGAPNNRGMIPPQNRGGLQQRGGLLKKTQSKIKKN